FATRNEYRGRIELLSRGSGRSEMEVAREAVLLTRCARRKDDPETTLPGVPERAEEDPGYHILAGGRRAFEKRLGIRVPWRIRLRRSYRSHGITGYLGSIVILTASLLGGLLFLTWTAG